MRLRFYIPPHAYALGSALSEASSRRAHLTDSPSSCPAVHQPGHIHRRLPPPNLAHRTPRSGMALSAAERVRRAAATLTTPGTGAAPALTLATITACMRELDTSLRAPGASGDEACAEFCAGPPPPEGER